MTAIANLPDLRPSLLLDFANSGRVDPRIQCTRSSTATCFGPDGKLRTVAANVPRIDYDPATGKCLGLLVEEARTNLLKNSDGFASAGWTAYSANLQESAKKSPLNKKFFKLVVPSGISTSNSSIRHDDLAKTAVATTYSLTVYAKAGEFNGLRLLPRDVSSAANSVDARFDLSNGTVTLVIPSGTYTNTSASISPVGDGWYKCTVVFTTGAESYVRIQILQMHNAAGANGDGVSGMYIAGVQLEEGSYPTSYIPTEGVAVTRATDVLQIAGTSFSSWYRQDEGTVFGQAVSRDTRTASYARLLEFAGSTTAYKMALVRNSAATRWNAEVVNEGVSNIFGSAGLGNVDGDLVGLAYKRDDFASASRGNPSVREAKSGGVPGITRLILGGAASGTGLINGHISKIAYYPRRLTNAELQRLTA